MTSTVLDSLLTQLWPNGNDPSADQVYWLLDGARDPQISQRVRYGELRFWSLYSGELTPRLRAAAPYLVQLQYGTAATLALLARGWGHGWGIFVVAPAGVSMFQVRLHLKKLLRVRTEEGTVLMFRYYDPRVLLTFLPTCTPEQFRDFLGDLTRLVIETEGGQSWHVFGS